MTPFDRFEVFTKSAVFARWQFYCDVTETGQKWRTAFEHPVFQGLCSESVRASTWRTRALAAADRVTHISTLSLGYLFADHNELLDETLMNVNGPTGTFMSTEHLLSAAPQYYDAPTCRELATCLLELRMMYLRLQDVDAIRRRYLTRSWYRPQNRDV